MTRKLRINITWDLDCEPDEYEEEMRKFELPYFIEYPILEDFNIDDYDLSEEVSEELSEELMREFVILDLQVVIIND